jgi:hypothetical protein
MLCVLCEKLAVKEEGVNAVTASIDTAIIAAVPPVNNLYGFVGNPISD